MVKARQKIIHLYFIINIKLNNVIRDINGKTGHMIVSAILDGETNPEILASYADYRIKATKENLIKSLEGNWRKEQLFNLKQAYDHINFLQHQLKECDKQTEEILDQFKENEIFIHSDDIEMKNPIRTLGEHEISVSPYLNITHTLKIKVNKN